MSVFGNIPNSTPDAAFSLMAAFREDSHSAKVDLTPGFYRDEKAEPWILPSVTQAKERLRVDPKDNHELQPLSGNPGFVSGAKRLIFGPNIELNDRVASIQTVAGTGANHIGARFLSDTLTPQNVWISDPSWINHGEVWKTVNPMIQRRLYPYYNKAAKCLDFEGMLSTLRKESVSGDVVILHACAHNPTGLDLSKEQWRKVSDVCDQKRLIPFFDVAYQGFATGDLAEDAWPIRHFFDKKTPIEFVVAQSFSKNFGLYGERVGALHIVALPGSNLVNITDALVKISRAELTAPPINGAKMVAQILSNGQLYEQWQKDLSHMSQRMMHMRRSLYEGLRSRNTPGDWDHILTDIGMFSILGLSQAQVDELRTRHHIYMLPSSRISFTGLTEMNVKYVADCLSAVILS